MPLNFATLQPAPVHHATAPDAAHAHSGTSTSGTMTLPGAHGGAQTVGIELLPSELIAHIASFLPLRCAHALGRTTRTISHLLASAQCEERARRARTPAEFGVLLQELRHAPSAVRGDAIARLVERLADLEPDRRGRAATLLRAALRHSPLWREHGAAVMSALDMTEAVRDLDRAQGGVRELVADAALAPQAQRIALIEALWDHIPTLTPGERQRCCTVLERFIADAELPRLDRSWFARLDELAIMKEAAWFEQMQEQDKAELQERQNAILAQAMASMLADMLAPKVYRW